MIFASLGLHAQQVDTTKVPSPKIVYKLALGTRADFGDRSVKFVKVISDSRCPKNVTCVWAGEAKVLLEIYRNDELVDRKEIVLAANSIFGSLFSSKDKSVGIYSLEPYPDINTPEANKKYVLKLIINKLSE